MNRPSPRRVHGFTASEAAAHAPLSILAARRDLRGRGSGVAPALVSAGAAAVLLVTRRVEPEKIYRQVDWGLLALFVGLFVVDVSTLAGNLTLIGSIANLVVAEGARRRGVRVSFVDYLRVGVPVTVLTLAFGVWWLS